MSNRVNRIASTIRDVVADALQNRLADPRLEVMASVTRVEVTSDLSYADIHVSVMASEGRQRSFMAAMESAQKAVQVMVAKRLKTRTCPSLRFHLDESIQKSFQTIRMIDDNMLDIQQRTGTPPSGDESIPGDDIDTMDCEQPDSQRTDEKGADQ